MSVHKTPTGRWKVRYRDGGGRNRSGGVYDRKGEATDKDDEIRRRKRRGDVAPDARSVRFDELFEDFAECRVEALAPATQRQWQARWLPTQRSLDRGYELAPWHLGHRWATWRLSDITFEAVQRWHAEMRRAGAGDATMSRAHDALSAVLKFACDRGIVARNAATQAGRPAYSATPVLPSSIWLPGDLEAIRADLMRRAASARRDYRWSRERDVVLFSVLAYHALRPWDEGCELEWAHLTDKTLTVVDSKTHKPRTLPLLEPVARELRDWRLRCGQPRRGLVFPRCEADIGRPAREVERIAEAGWTARIFAPSVENAGLDYQRPYHLRHSCISMWLAEGRRHNVVAKWAGHSVTTLVKTYDHVIEEWELRENFDLLAELRRARGEVPAARRLQAV